MTRWGEVEAFGSYLSDGSLHGDMVRTINLCEEVCFNMDDNDTIFSQSTSGHTEAKYSVFPKS